jgi:hypothetical protein
LENIWREEEYYNQQKQQEAEEDKDESNHSKQLNSKPHAKAKIQEYPIV